MVDRLWKLEFHCDQSLQRVCGFEEEPSCKKIFTNGLIAHVYMLVGLVVVDGACRKLLHGAIR